MINKYEQYVREEFKKLKTTKYGFNIKKIQEKLTAGVNSRQKFEGETGIRTSNILAIKN